MEQSDTVLVLISFTGGFYFGESLAGIQHEIARAGGRLVVHQTSAQVLPYVEADLPQATTPVAWGHAVGAISVAGAAGRSSLERLTESGVPVVLASQSIPGFPAPVAMPDNLGGTSAAVAHLLGHGHTRIGFVGNIAGTDMRERYAAYHQTLVDHGLAPEPTHFLPCAENGEIGGTQAAERFLALAERPTAVMCATDRNAVGFMARVRRAGLSVPEDVAVIGFDNIEAGAYAAPALATVDQKFHAVGALAGRLLVRLVEDGPDAFPDGTVEHAPSAHVVPRSSCGCTGDAAHPATRTASPDRSGTAARRTAVPDETQARTPGALLRADLTAALETDRSSGATEHVEATALAVEHLVLDSLRTGLVPPADHVAGAVEAASRALLRAEGLDGLVSAIDTYLRAIAATGGTGEPSLPGHHSRFPGTTPPCRCPTPRASDARSVRSGHAWPPRGRTCTPRATCSARSAPRSRCSRGTSSGARCSVRTPHRPSTWPGSPARTSGWAPSRCGGTASRSPARTTPRGRWPAWSAAASRPSSSRRRRSSTRSARKRARSRT